MFLKRSYQPEIMDDFSIRDNRVDAALNELKLVNKFLGGISVTSSGIKEILTNKKECISVLDIGAGASDILIKLQKNGYNFNITSLDINPRACFYLKKFTPVSKIVCGDVSAIPFRNKFHLIHASLFLHHFKEDEIAQLIRSFLLLAEKGIIINDLRRSILAYYGIRLLTVLFSNSRMVRHDGPLSVKRGFIKKDWDKILQLAGIKQYIIKRKWAFRWLIVIYNDKEV